MTRGGKSAGAATSPVHAGEFGRPAPYSEGKRLGYGLLWSAWTLLLSIW